MVPSVLGTATQTHLNINADEAFQNVKIILLPGCHLLLTVHYSSLYARLPRVATHRFT